MKTFSFKLSNYIILVYFFLLFYSRVLVDVGLPSLFIHMHFAIALLIFFLSIYIAKGVVYSKLLLFFLAFIWVNFFSSIINSVSVLNSILNFMILFEPLMLGYSMIVMHKNNLLRTDSIEKYLWLFLIVNTVFIIYQFVTVSNSDDVKGVLLHAGNGHHVISGSLAVICLYLIHVSKSFYTKLILFLLMFSFIIASDAKQVLLVILVSFGLIVFFNIYRLKSLLLGLLFLGLLTIVTPLMSETAYAVWINKGFGIIEEGILSKFYVFNYMLNEPIESILFGLGPGQTVSRLAMMLSDYPLFIELGASEARYYDYFFAVQQSNYITNTTTGTSLFTLMYTTTGLIGDLGIFGVFIFFSAYLYLLMNVFYSSYLLSKFLILMALVFSMISLWLGEPNFSVVLVVVMFLLKIRFSNESFTTTQ